MKGNGNELSATISAKSYAPFTFQLLSRPIEIAFCGHPKEQRTQREQLFPILILLLSSVIFCNGQFAIHLPHLMHLSMFTFINGTCTFAYHHSTLNRMLKIGRAS